MVLKEYINFEKQIEHNLISVTHYEFNALEDSTLTIEIGTNLSIFINIGNMVNTIHNNNNNNILLLPPKNAYLLNDETFEIKTCKGKYIKYTIIEFKNELQHFLLKNINSSIDKRYNHIFASNKFNFDFPLNIDILTLIEEIYKIDYSNDNVFSNLEIKAKSFYLLYNILRKILFMDYKYIEQVSTIYSRYYASLKNIFDNQMNLENSLDL